MDCPFRKGIGMTVYLEACKGSRTVWYNGESPGHQNGKCAKGAVCMYFTLRIQRGNIAEIHSVITEAYRNRPATKLIQLNDLDVVTKACVV